MSEQLGWRSIIKNLRREMPQWSTILPTLPRKVDAYLSHDAEQKQALQDQLNALQQNQLKLQKTMQMLMILVAVLLLVLAWIWLLS